MLLKINNDLYQVGFSYKRLLSKPLREDIPTLKNEFKNDIKNGVFPDRMENAHPIAAACYIKINGNITHVGVSWCSNEDNFNKVKGRGISFSRAVAEIEDEKIREQLCSLFQDEINNKKRI